MPSLSSSPALSSEVTPDLSEPLKSIVEAQLPILSPGRTCWLQKKLDFGFCDQPLFFLKSLKKKDTPWGGGSLFLKDYLVLTPAK